ncbi:MAG: flagellar M-ring protein FliF [Acidobacteria bacterium]|nr:flagellar M-ring protein FliF [Acidobacteriota bacterium]
MNPEQLFARLNAAASSLSGRQIVTLAFAFVSVVGVTIASAYYLNTPSYGVLFSDMDPESAGAVVTRLKAAKVQYVLDDGGRTVKVPVSRIDELRLDVAAQGMPGSGRIGFEIFDRTSFGVTDFMEHVNYRRALEGELARTISTIAEVAGARVHVAMPPASLFVGQSQPTTASVVLKLRQNRQLSPATVSAITNFVAASVESLRPESVVVIDNFGRPLSRPQAAPDDMGGTEQLERQQTLERDLSVRLVSLLEPIVGPGRVRVNVNAKLETNTREETEEVWDPTPVIRSQQRTSQTSNSPNPGAAGVAASAAAAASGGGSVPGVVGARANLPANPNAPPAAAAAPGQAAPMMASSTVGNSSTSEVTNYEVSKLTRHVIQPQGQIARLSVAVVLDDNRAPAEGAAEGQTTATPRSAEEIQKIRDLVSAAVGFDAMRGDQLTVENIAFEEPPVEEIVPVPVWERYEPQAFEAVRIIGILLLGAFAFFGVIRPMIAGALRPAQALKRGAIAAGGQVRTVEDMESEIEAELQNGNAAASRRLPVLTRRVATLSEKEPENTARLLRAWLTEEER